MKRLCLLFVLILTVLTAHSAKAEEKVDMKNPVPGCEKLIEQGLHKDALDILKPWCLDPKNAESGDYVAPAVRMVVSCSIQLNRINEVDVFLEKAAEVHGADWRVLEAIGGAYLFQGLPTNGFLVDGKFERGPHRGGGQWVDSSERDRVRALQLYVKAVLLAWKGPEETDLSALFGGLVNALKFGREDWRSWKLQSLTDLTTLPDYETNRYWRGGETKTPVDAQGNPIFYGVPESFETAKSDGERWRWTLEQWVKHDPSNSSQALLQRAEFSRSQFGEQTLQSFPFFRNRDADDAVEKTASIWNLKTLGDHETIAKLATGIKRFELPDEFNYIALYKEVLKTENKGNHIQALEALADTMMNRMQYVRAAEYYRTLLENYLQLRPDSKEFWQSRLDQIEKNWGRFEPTQSKVAGLNAELGYVFRNGKKVKLTAHEIKIDTLIADIKAYLKSKPVQLDWNRSQIDQIGWQLIHGRDDEEKAPVIREKYLGKQVADWNVDLEPATEHFDRRTTVSVPIEKGGAYLIKAEMEEGNTEYVVLWLNDTAIVKKQLDESILYFVADAKTGQPVVEAELDFFGYATKYESTPAQGGRRRQANSLTWSFDEFSAASDSDGLYYLHNKDKERRGLNWLITARDGKGRFAYYGFDGIWFARKHDEQYKAVKTFFISDRPVYRPGDKVEMKAWVGTAKYDMPNTNEYAGKPAKYEIYDPKGEKIVEKSEITLDSYGGMTTELELPGDATLGVYRFVISWSREAGGFAGGGTFRVEEYKKPEYEVSVEAPKEPVALGEKIKAKIKAKYYFGSPVTEATVKYKVVRNTYNDEWFPVRPWDWFYGRGYWWFAYDYDWLPGWNRWGTCRPAPFWMPRSSGPPEVVAEQEVQIGEDGTVEIEIDSSLAQAMFPKDSQKYTITAEVVDNSRRTIVGSGSVLVAKEPFKVYGWVNRGYYKPGQQVVANFQTRRMDGKPVSGDAEVKLYKISYVPNKEAGVSTPAQVPAYLPIETEVHKAPVKFNEDGSARLSLSAAEPGQYRISCTISGQEGGYVFSVYNDKNNEPRPVVADWKFADLELVPDKEEFAPGENVALRVNTNRENGFVLLFAKAANDICLKPQILRLDGKSTQIDVPVEVRDMPNFFIEALIVSDGQVFSEVKELVVPPQKRIVNVDVVPSAETYKPGGKAQAELIVTDMEGKPVVGQTVVSIYDKSVEYISGGSNVGDIKEFFWKWRRRHNPSSQSNLQKHSGNIQEPGKPGMEMLGIFGNYVALELDPVFSRITRTETFHYDGRMNNSMRGGGMGGFGGAMMMDAAAPAAAPMMAKSKASSVDRAVDFEVAEAADGSFDGQWEGGDEMVEPTIRKNFADTALWVGALETDENGKAKIELDMPESLTTWKINVWAMGLGTRVGYGSAEVITRKDLILRMQTPRFLIEKDKVVFSANVHNYLPNEKEVKVVLDLKTPEQGDITKPQQSDLKSPERSEAEFGGKPESTEHPETSLRCVSGSLAQTVKIPAGGEARVDWWVEAQTAGDAEVTMKALTDEESDAMQKTLPVYVHGMLKQEAFSGYISPNEGSGVIELNVPEERRPEQTQLTVRFSPSLAASMIDALPYLAEYPYGCTEQTLNRFLPTVIVQKILIDMNIDLEKLKRLKTNLNAQELGEDRKPALSRNLQRRRVEPVYDTEQLQEMISDGVTRLTNMQCSDGGWGWFSGRGEYSSAHLTALVVHGLNIAKTNGVKVDDNVIRRGMAWLSNYQAGQVELLQNAALSDDQKKDKRWKDRADENDAFVMMVLWENADPNALYELDAVTSVMQEFLRRDRAKLSLYGIAMLGIFETSPIGSPEEAKACVQLLEQYLVQDDENQTAYLNLAGYSGWSWWSWHGSEFETQAYYLKLLMRTDPKSPVAPRLVKYLLNNRRHATYWNSTRDTAIVIEAFAEYIKASGEDKPLMVVEALVDGEVKKTVEITSENLFEIDNTLVLGPEEITTGKHKVELRKKGDGPLYFNAYLEIFTLEDPIEKTGLEVKVERRIYRLDRDESAAAQVAGDRGQVLDLKVEKYKRTPISEFKSGDLVEIELVVESKNDYESILIEDMKAAGLEPVDVRSGYNGNALGAYVEFRDERVAFFVYRLARGKHSVSYRLRAETPGQFSALPTKIWAMYAPELKGNSDENKVRVDDKE